jgi:hypothetical protein
MMVDCLNGEKSSWTQIARSRFSKLKNNDFSCFSFVFISSFVDYLFRLYETKLFESHFWVEFFFFFFFFFCDLFL